MLSSWVVLALAAAPHWADAQVSGDTDMPTFDFQLAHWTFRGVEEVVRDEAGRRHHLRLPTTGFTRHKMFGRAWNGQQPAVLLKDHPDFAPTGPFRVSATVMFDEQRVTGRARLLGRVGEGGKVAYALDFLEGDVVRFTVGDGSGKTASVEGKITDHPTHTISIYANFDSETGELSLYGQCRELGKAVTGLRPPPTLPGAHLELLTGWKGYVTELSIERGLMLPDGELDGQCAFVGSKLEDPALRAAAPKPTPRSTQKVPPATGPTGILRAKPGDFAVFDLHEWDYDRLGSDESTEVRGQLTIRRIEGEAPYLFELGIRLDGELRLRPAPDAYQHVVQLEPFVETQLFAYPPDVDLAAISFDPKAPRQKQVGQKTFAGVAFTAFEVQDEGGRWTRLVDETNAKVALSGGLLSSVYGTPKTGRGWDNRLAKVGTGPSTSPVPGVWAVPRETTPYLVADGPMQDARRDAAWKARRLAERSAYKLGEALDGCSPILHDQRRVAGPALVALQGGKVIGVEAKGEKPDAKTMACLKQKAAGLKLSNRLVQLAVTWTREGPKTEWELQRENVARSLSMAYLYLCADEAKLLDGFVASKATALLLFDGSVLTVMKIGGKPAPDALVACFRRKLDETPVSGEGPLEISIPFERAEKKQ